MLFSHWCRSSLLMVSWINKMPFVIKRKHFGAKITFCHLVDDFIQSSLYRVQQYNKLMIVK